MSLQKVDKRPKRLFSGRFRGKSDDWYTFHCWVCNRLIGHPASVRRGKHNPAGVRMKYAAQDHEFTNQTAVLPVVTVRHPITWLNALCNHGYSLHWSHDTALCDSTLQLDHIVEAKFGYTNQSVVYDSLIDVWRNWNLQYFQENKYPLVMIRLEDIVYRPKQVVTEICHCIGGELYSDKPFSVFENSMNDGNGHGEHRSDGILSAFVKFAKPVKEWRQKFSSNDWVVIDKVLQDDKGLLSAFNYLMPNVWRGKQWRLALHH